MTPRTRLARPMPAPAPTRSQLNVRLDPDLLEQVDAAASAFGGVERAEAARRLIRQAVESRLPEPPPRAAERAEQVGYVPSPEECVTILNFLTDTLNDHLERVARHYPVGAVAEAYNLGSGLLGWASLQAEQYGTTVEAMLDRAKAGEQ